MKRTVTFLTLMMSIMSFAQTYTQIDKIIASDRAEFGRFGQAVAITDTWAVVGAYGMGNYNNGQVYIYEKQGANWVQTQILQNSDNENYDRFGYSVAIDGDWLIVGAPREDDDENGNNNISKAGSVYIFKNNGGTWSQTQKIVANDRSTDDEFGWSLDIDGNTIIVGAHQDFEDVNGLNPIHHAGSCYFFDLNVGTGMWSQTQKIVASDRASDLYYPNGHVGEDLSDQFGHTVGISGNYVIVGALNHDFRPNGSQGWQCGSAYIFERNGGVWTEVQHIINSDNAASGGWERFGSDVAIDSNIIVVGMWAQDFTPTGTDYMKNAGAAYIFIRNNVGVWNENQKIVAGMRNSGDHFGWDVKINDGFIIAGTEHDDHDENESNPLHEAGSAYIFQIDGSGTFNQIQKIVGSDRDSLDVFGYAVDIYGTNLIAGAFQHDWNLTQADSMQEAGAAYIWSSVNCPPVFNNQSATICQGQTYTVGTSTYTTSGTYNDYFTAASGCDSIVTTNLTVIPTYDTTFVVAICDGDTYTVGSSTYTMAGNYTDVLQTINGCDSTVHTNLSINPIYNTNQNVEICDGDTYIIGSSSYTTTGNYTDVLTSISGCDSTVTTNLIVHQTHFTQSIGLCPGETYYYGNNTYSTAGVYTDTLQATTTCDSIMATTITINPPIEVNQSIELCYGETYSIGNSTYAVSGNYNDTIQMTNSTCDSIVHTNLTINSAINITNTINGNNITANQNNASYQWLDCDNNNQPINNATQQTLTVDHLGNFACIVTISSCSDTTNCVFVNYVGLNQLNLSEILNIYPNPSKGEFTIDLTSYNQNYTIKIVDITGKIIYQNNIMGNTKTIINLKNVANGLYFVEVKSNDVRVTQKIMIQK